MTTTKINVNCGCGFTASKIEAAESHASKTGHTLHIQGEVSGEKQIQSKRFED